MILLCAFWFRYDEALDMLDSIIKLDETNAAPRKRRIAILRARGKIPDAIKELTEYLKRQVFIKYLEYAIL
jgi:transcription elongation factor GreA-like protein